MRRLRFKHFLRERNALTFTGDETLLSVSEYYGVKPRSEAFSHEEYESRAESLEGYRIVKRGDFVMNYMLAWKGAYGLSEHDGIVSPAYAVFQVDNRIIDRRYLHHRSRSNDMKSAFRSRSKGIIDSRLRLYPDSLLAMEIDLPELSTQRRIAKFLDRETGRIDELIGKKSAFRGLIATFEETRFLATVTGKEMHGERADSGVRWIGTLPEGWLAPKFTMVARQESGHTPSRKEPSYWIPDECIIPWVSLADVWQLRSGKTVYLADTAEKISEIGMANSSARLLPEGTVVLSRTASVGFSGILAKPMATTQDFAAWICGPTIRPKFLYYVLRAMKPEFRRLMMGSTHQTIYMPDIRAFRTPLPPLAEQDRIIAALDASISSYRKVHERLTESVSMLREYRSALITAAVTGQIDVDTYDRTGKTSATLDRIEEETQA